MVSRFLYAVALCAGFWAATARADVTAQLFPLTGEVRLLNRGETPVPIVFYSISSSAGALNGSNAVWKSITQNYDSPFGASPGNGLVDPDGEWIKLSSSSTALTEGALDVDGGSLPALRAISLGLIWDPDQVAFPDLIFDIQNDAESVPVTVELALDGDYSADQVVDAADYLLWRKIVDSMMYAYYADGDLDGAVDVDDYVVWQHNFGLTLPLPPYGPVGSGGGLSPVAGGVPEPTSFVLFSIAAGMISLLAQRARTRSVE
jgi:hypothetical protein